MTQFHCSFKKNDSTDLACLDSSHTQFGTVSLLKYNEKQKAQQESRGKKRRVLAHVSPHLFSRQADFWMTSWVNVLTP